MKILIAATLFLASPLLAQSIPQIQGAGARSPLEGQTVTISGTVTGDFRGEDALSGFFLQDAGGDGNPETSDGIFVFLPSRSAAASATFRVGDTLRVRGRVEEFARRPQNAANAPDDTDAPQNLPSQTQIRAFSIENLGTNAPISPMFVSLPLPENSDFERFESMLVTFSQTLIVTGQNELLRFGSLLLAPSRQFNPTNLTPVSQVNFAEVEKLRARSLLVLDDGVSRQFRKPMPYLDAQNTRRTGSGVRDLTGILTFDFERFRLHPTQTVTFSQLNPRPNPPRVSGLKIAGVNVQNFWTTYKNRENPNARGAKNQAEFERQTTKIVAMLRGLDADIVGLMELENNGETAISTLVRALNAAYGKPVYAFVKDPKTGAARDAIKCGFIYKPARVELVGAAQSARDEIFDRFPLSQTFRDKASKGVFTAIANHFKSKGSAPESGDVDKGEGAWNQKRTQQARALLEFAKREQARTKDADVLLLGDFNAYSFETPILTIKNAGYKHLNLRVAPEKRYSYSFNGMFGSLDHALASASLDAQISDVAEWHINSDEPYFLSYGTVSAQDFQPNAFRASDHDPVLLGLKLRSNAPKPVVKPAPPRRAAPPVRRAAPKR